MSDDGTTPFVKELLATAKWDHIDGIPRRQWLDQCLTVRAHMQDHGILPISVPMCEGGLCKRHAFQRPVKVKTSDGLMLCSDCAVVWAVRRHFNLKHGNDDL